jgi:hypothetical protein
MLFNRCHQGIAVGSDVSCYIVCVVTVVSVLSSVRCTGAVPAVTDAKGKLLVPLLSTGHKLEHIWE